MNKAKPINIPDGWITVAEWARQRGQSAPALFMAIKRGRVPSAKRFGRNLMVDPAVANPELEGSRDGRGGRRQRNDNSRVNNQTEADTPPDDPAAPPENLTQAKTRHEIIKASLAELELAEKEGRLVDVSKVQAEAFRTARLVRDNMLNIPDRLAGTLAALTDPHQVHEALTREIRMALEGLAQ